MEYTEEDKLLSHEDNININNKRSSCYRCCTRPYLVEPLLLLYWICFASYVTMGSEFIYARVEEDYKDNRTSINITYGDNKTENVDSRISTEASDWSIYTSLSTEIPMLFSSSIMISLSGRFGRKPMMLIACIGNVLNIGVFMIVAGFHLPMGYLFIGTTCGGLFGGAFIISGAAYLYVIDRTHSTDRTYRFMIISSISILAGALANVIVGYTVAQLSWFYCFLVILSGYSLCFLWVLLLLPESLNSIRENEVKHESHGCYAWLSDIVNSFKIYLQPRTPPWVKRFLIMLLITGCTGIIVSAAPSVLYPLYLLGPPFHLDSITLGYFIGATSVSKLIGMLVIVKLLQKCGFSDLVILTLAYLSNTVADITVGVTKTETILFISVVFGSLGNAILPLTTAIMAAHVKNEERSAVQASLNCAISVGNILSSSGALAIYGATIGVFPGSVFLLLGVGNFMHWLTFSIIWCIVGKKSPASSLCQGRENI